MRENQIIEDVLNLMGLTKDERDPLVALASKKNFSLLNLVEELKKKRDDSIIIHNYYNNRLERIKENLKIAKRERGQNLAVIESHKSQHASEDHQYKMVVREESSLVEILNDLQREQNEVVLQHDRAKMTISKLNASMEALADSINVTKAMLNEWKQVVEQNFETEDLIKKYSKVDSSKFESLDSMRKLLLTAIDKQSKRLISATEEQMTLEHILERTSQLYRQGYKERRELIFTWKEAVNQMTQRENYVREMENELDKAREMTQLKIKQMYEETNRLNERLGNKRVLEMRLEQLNSSQSALQQNYFILESALKTNISDYASLRKEVQNLSQRLSSQRNKNRTLSQDEISKGSMAVKGVAELEKLKNKYEGFKTNTATANERLKHIDDFIVNEENNIKIIEQDLNRLNSAFFSAQQNLLRMQETTSTYELECQAIESSIGKTMQNNKLDNAELSRQTNISYRLGFSVQQACARIANMDDTKSISENFDLNIRIKSLENNRDTKKRSYDIVLTQTTKILNDIKKMTMEYNNGALEIENLSGKLKETKLKVEGGEKICKQKLEVNQEGIIQVNMIRMKIRQMEAILINQEDKSYNFEKHKMELENAVQERLLKLKSQNQILSLKKKCLNDEKSELKVEITDRNVKVNNFKKRCDIVINLLGKNEDGSVITATQIKIETAQQKYCLMMDGNKLNNKVQKAEKDIHVIEGVLKLMTHSNDRYKKNFEKAEDTSFELKVLDDLHTDYCILQNQLKNLRSALSNKMLKIEYLTNEKMDLERDYEDAERCRLDSNDVLIKLQKEIIDQKEKIDRSDRDLHLAIKAVRRKLVDSDSLYLFERDINTQELEDRDNSALQQLADCVAAYPGMGPSVTRYLYERGLKMPSRSATVWRSGESLNDYSIKVDRVCSRMTNKSFMSSTSSAASTTSVGTKATKKTSASVTVVTIDFDEAAKKNGGKRSTRKT